MDSVSKEAVDRAESFAKSLHCTPEEHDDIMVAVRFARLQEATRLAVVEEWQKPYRTMDAAGSPESASSVAWEWINRLAEASPDGTGFIENTQLGADNGAIILYRGSKPYAVATVFRDAMNFAVLVRWKDPVPRALQPKVAGQ